MNAHGCWWADLKEGSLGQITTLTAYLWYCTTLSYICSLTQVVSVDSLSSSAVNGMHHERMMCRACRQRAGNKVL